MPRQAAYNVMTNILADQGSKTAELYKTDSNENMGDPRQLFLASATITKPAICVMPEQKFGHFVRTRKFCNCLIFSLKSRVAKRRTK